MKICSRCKKELPETEFHKSVHHKGGLKPDCKSCRRAYNIQYCQDNKEKFAIWGAKQKVKMRAWLEDLKRKPCMDCGGVFPTVCMDFDHTRGEKFKGISKMIEEHYSKEKILAEMDKCDLICANCHRIRTWIDRKQDWYDKRRKYDRSTWNLQGP